MRLAAGLCPDPLGELELSPRPLSHNWGEGCLLLRGRERGHEGALGTPKALAAAPPCKNPKQYKKF